jgi:hypothetical protein
MFTTFTALALAGGGALRLVLQWQLRKRWDISLAVPQVLAGALVVLAGLPEFIKPFPFPVPLSLTLGLLLPDLLLRRG